MANREYQCGCGGQVYVVGSAQWSKCSRGVVHCNKCEKPASRRGKGFACGCHLEKK